MVLALDFSAIFGGLRGGLFQYAIARVVREMRSDLFNSLVKQDIGFYDLTKTGMFTVRFA